MGGKLQRSSPSSLHGSDLEKARLSTSSLGRMGELHQKDLYPGWIWSRRLVAPQEINLWAGGGSTMNSFKKHIEKPRTDLSCLNIETFVTSSINLCCSKCKSNFLVTLAAAEKKSFVAALQSVDPVPSRAKRNIPELRTKFKQLDFQNSTDIGTKDISIDGNRPSYVYKKQRWALSTTNLLKICEAWTTKVGTLCWPRELLVAF